MINASSLRVGQTQNYPVRFPLMGRAFLDRDYNVALLQGQTLAAVGHHYFKYNQAWRASQQIYSHSVVTWWNQTWVVQLFILQELPPVDHHSQIEEGLIKMITYITEITPALEFKLNYDQLIDKQLPLGVHQPLSANDRFRILFGWPSENLRSKFDFFQPLNRPGQHRWVERNSLAYDTEYYGEDQFHKISTFSYYLDRKGRQRFDKRVLPVRWPRRYDRFQRVYVDHLEAGDQIRLRRMFYRFVRLVRPRKQWRPFLLLSEALAKDYQKVIKNRVRFVWRVIQHASEGGINLWLGWFTLKINQRGTYHTRRIAYPLLSWAHEQEIDFKGFRLRCAGRFTRQQRADYQVMRFGRCTNPANLRQRVDQVFFTFPLKFGAIGLTLTVNF